MAVYKISVIVPIYNIEGYIERCVGSLTAQTYRDLQIILVDDGSTDNSGSICDALAQKDHRIQVIHKENGGAASARNAGLDVAEGEYISFIDSDDYIAADTYERLTAQMDSMPDVVRFGFYEICDGEVKKDWVQDYAKGLHTGDALRDLRLDSISFPNVLDYERMRILSVWAGLFRRSFLEQNRIRFRSEREVLNEDFLFMVHVMHLAQSVYIHSYSCYYYVTRKGSLSRTYSPRLYERKQVLFDAYCELANTDDPETVARLDNFYIDCIYDCFVRECARNGCRKDALAQIRRLFDDQRLQLALARNKDRIKSKKTKAICSLMRHKMVRLSYVAYNMVRVLTK